MAVNLCHLLTGGRRVKFHFHRAYVQVHLLEIVGHDRQDPVSCAHEWRREEVCAELDGGVTPWQ